MGIIKALRVKRYSKGFLLRTSAINEQYRRLYEDFIEFGQDVWVQERYDAFNIAFSLYDEHLEVQGTLIFVINPYTMRSLIEMYPEKQGFFWCLRDKYQQVILSSEFFPVQENEQAALFDVEKEKVLSYVLSHKSYRIYHGKSHLGVSVVLGVSSDM